MHNEVLKLKNEPKNFFKKLHKLKYSEYKDCSEDFTDLIVNLSNNDNIDFCKLAVSAIQKGFSSFDIVHIIKDCFHLLKLDIKTVQLLYKLLNEKMKNDMANGYQYDLTKIITSNNTTLAQSIIESFQNIEEDYIIGHIATYFNQLSLNDFDNIHTEIFSKIETSKGNFRNGLIQSIGIMNYENKPEKLRISVKFLRESVNTENLNYIASAMINLYKYSNDLINDIINFKERNIPNIDYQISLFLLKNIKEVKNEKWLCKLLLYFTNTKDDHKGIIDNLDYVLENLVKTNSENLIIDFFVGYYNYEERDVRKHIISKTFDSTISALYDKQKLLQMLITVFFNQDDSKFHILASQILDKNNFHKKKPAIGLDLNILQKLKYDDHIFICRKILGYIFDTKIICSLLFSILQIKSLEKDLKLFIYSFFIHLLSVNDPSETKSFFINKSDKSQFNKAQLDLEKLVIEQIENHNKKISKLKHLKEFSLPTKYYYQLQLEKNKEMSEMLNKKENQSVFMQMMTKIPLKFGRGSFSFLDHINDYSHPSFLSEIRHSVTIPLAEISYPVDSSLLRFKFQMAKRGY